MDPAHAPALPGRREDRVPDLLPFSIAGQIDQKGAKQGDFSAPAQPSFTEWRVMATVCLEGSGWELCT